MTQDCDRCGRRFGGLFGYDRHIARRGQGPEGKCRTDGALHRRGIFADADGVWRRRTPSLQGSFLGLGTWTTGGSRTVEERAKDHARYRASRTARARRSDQESDTPQETLRVLSDGHRRVS